MLFRTAIRISSCKTKSTSLNSTIRLRCNPRVFLRIPHTRLRIFLLPNKFPISIGYFAQRAEFVTVITVGIITGVAGGTNSAASSVWRREPGICIIFLFDQINPGISRYFIVFDFINLMRCRIKIYK